MGIGKSVIEIDDAVMVDLSCIRTTGLLAIERTFVEPARASSTRGAEWKRERASHRCVTSVSFEEEASILQIRCWDIIPNALDSVT